MLQAVSATPTAATTPTAPVLPASPAIPTPVPTMALPTPGSQTCPAGHTPAPAPASSFPRFASLPPELRIEIWRHAIADAFERRVIRTHVYRAMQSTMHVCANTTPNGFCGSHAYCPAKQDAEHPQFELAYCMTSGYFFVPDDENGKPNNGSGALTDAPSADALEHRLGLACREARQCVLERCPQTMRIYRGRWRGDGDARTPPPRCRLVRFHPARDLVVLLRVHGPPAKRSHFVRPRPASSAAAVRHAAARRREDDFLADGGRRFAAFRAALGSLQRVALPYQAPWTASGDNDDGDGSGDHQSSLALARASMAVNDATLNFVAFALFMESLGALHLADLFRDGRWGDEGLCPTFEGLDLGAPTHGDPHADEGGVLQPEYEQLFGGARGQEGRGKSSSSPQREGEDAGGSGGGGTGSSGGADGGHCHWVARPRRVPRVDFHGAATWHTKDEPPKPKPFHYKMHAMLGWGLGHLEDKRLAEV